MQSNLRNKQFEYRESKTMWNDKITARYKQAFRPIVKWICDAS